MNDFVTKQTERKAMGLAASQARFLAITSRKANCEFQSMQIAQDKLSVTRELARATQQYQDALNATTLVWDYDGTGENTYNLSYGVMMTPTVLNNFNPYLVTTRTGSVVLNAQMAKAAQSISPQGAPAARSVAGFAQFMEALAGAGVVSSSMATAITNITNTTYSKGSTIYVNPSPDIINNESLTLVQKGKYDKNAGYGSEPLNKNGASAKNIYGLASRLKDVKIDDNFEDFNIYVGGKLVTGDERKELTLGDVLTNDVKIVRILNDNCHLWEDTDPNKEDAKLFYDQIVNFFADMTSNTGGKLYGILATDLAAQKALASAAAMTSKQFFVDEASLVNGHGISQDASKNRTLENLAVNNQFIWVQNKGSKLNSSVGINLSNLFGYYLTQFELIYNGYASDYSIGPSPKTCNFVTADPYYNYLMNDTDAVNSDIVMKADFYMQMYNNICVNGWTQSEGDIEDDEYLEQMLKNGNYFVTSLSQDGYFYQGRYNEGDCIVEVKDEDAIAQAEADFASKKTRLTYKEEQLDLNMKNLDAEISSLTTEYDSVKNLISKNVEKVFTMFQ